MSSESTTAVQLLPPGVYRISVISLPGLESEGANAFVGQYLTDDETHVTILPSNPHIQPRQLWRVTPGEHGSYVIGRPSDKWPSPYLTYQGDHQKPKEGDRIKLQISDFPLTHWDLKHFGRGFYIRAEKSDLGIGIGRERIFPPFLILSERELTWTFEFVHPESR